MIITSSREFPPARTGLDGNQVHNWTTSNHPTQCACTHLIAVRTVGYVVYIGHPPVPAGKDRNSIGKIIYDSIGATAGVTASGFIRSFKGGCYDGQLVIDTYEL